MRKSPSKSFNINLFRFLNQVQFREELLKIYPKLKEYTGCESIDKAYDSVEIITAEVMLERLSGIVRHPVLRERCIEYLEHKINTDDEYRNLVPPIEYRNHILGLLNYNLHLFCERDLVFLNREAATA